MRNLLRGVVSGVLVLALGGGRPAQAQFGGGGPAGTDCFLQYTGVTSSSATCVDGDACDADGMRDGSCTFAISACTNQPLGSCPATPLDGLPTIVPASDAASALASAIGALPASGGCTPPGIVVPLKISLAGIKPGKVKLTIKASAGGKKDTDKLKLTCQPSTVVPTFTTDVMPIFGQVDQGTGQPTPGSRCAVPQCHFGPAPSQSLNLSGAAAYDKVVNVHSTVVPKYFIVKPGSFKTSMMARKVLGGKNIPPGGGVEMPNGCPNAGPVTGCLTSKEFYTLLAWIKNGAAR